MEKDWYDKYGKEFHCADCTFLDSCLKKDEPLYSRCCEQYLRDRIAELEEQLANSIRPKFKPNNDLFVIVGYKDETKSIEQYYIDEIVIRGNGKLVEYRDIEQEIIIGENNLLFSTYEEAQAKLEELQGE